MAKKSVIFHCPVKLGKTLYPKSKVAVEVDEELLKGSWIASMAKEGNITLAAPAVKAAEQDEAAAPAKKAAK